MTYEQLKDKHREEMNSFKGVFFAFSNEQFAEGMKKLGLSIEDTGKIFKTGFGGYILRDRHGAFADMLARFKREESEFYADPKNLYNAIVYELLNHEYCVTYDQSDALEALGLKAEDIDSELLQSAKDRVLAICGA